MLLENHNAIEVGGYAISNSLRFQSASSQYLNRTPSSAGNRKTWTWSAWVKRGTLGSTESKLFGASISTVPTYIMFSDNVADALTFAKWNGSSHDFRLTTTQVFRDPSAWYHIVIALDTTQATNTNRIKIYVNGTQVTAFGTATYPSLNYDADVSNNVAHYLGLTSSNTSNPFDGYMTEVNFIDGQALTPSSFGETDTTTGQWIAKKYTGTYGTNGFYLPFSNGTSTTTLGADSSGNGNNWTLTNFTRSSGVSDCWMIDVPSGNGGASGTQPSSNYCVFNPTTANTTNLINANLTRNGAVRTNVGSILLTSGKYYFETTIQDSNGNGGVGVKQATAYPLEGYNTAAGASYFANGEYKIEGAAQTSGFSSYTNGDVIGIAVDTTISPAKIWFSKNNTWQGTGNPTTAGYSLTAGLDYYFMVLHGSGASSTTASANFGQRSFAYTPPTGFKALCTANLPEATIKQGNQYMDATLYTGNGAVRSITGYNFSPDFAWIKSRSAIGGHRLFDTVRGATRALYSNLTNAEAVESDSLTAFNSDGYSLGADTVGGGVNINGVTYVGWAWDAGSSTVTNTSGSISSQVRANPTAGFSVVTYTGTGANATVGHGLGVAPKMIIVKSRSNTGGWNTYHESLGNTKGIYLNLTQATTTSANFWNNTSPTSSVFTLSGANECNGSGFTSVAYCFSEIAGFSKFGSYTGNGSADGVFVYTGFRPKFVMIKRTDSSGDDWVILDTARSTFNVAKETLSPNASSSENSINCDIDFLSNGFKLRHTQVNFLSHNANGGTYIYACFAESPFASSNAR